MRFQFYTPKYFAQCLAYSRYSGKFSYCSHNHYHPSYDQQLPSEMKQTSCLYGRIASSHKPDAKTTHSVLCLVLLLLQSTVVRDWSHGPSWKENQRVMTGRTQRTFLFVPCKPVGKMAFLFPTIKLSTPDICVQLHLNRQDGLGKNFNPEEKVFCATLTFWKLLTGSNLHTN